MTRIFVLDGHPDPSSERFCAALADAYAGGARRSGYEVRRLDLGSMNFPFLRSMAEFRAGPVAEDALRVQDAIKWADHIAIIYPLWMGGQPALLRALFEQVFRYGFVRERAGDQSSKRLLKGKTAHSVITMRMSAWAYRWAYGAHGARCLEKNLLNFAGIRPVCRSIIGSVEAITDGARRKWLRRMQEAGARAR